VKQKERKRHKKEKTFIFCPRRRLKNYRKLSAAAGSERIGYAPSLLLRSTEVILMMLADGSLSDDNEETLY
jgi:hypothetical protein